MARGSGVFLGTGKLGWLLEGVELVLTEIIQAVLQMRNLGLKGIRVSAAHSVPAASCLLPFSGAEGSEHAGASES